MLSFSAAQDCKVPASVSTLDGIQERVAHRANHNLLGPLLKGDAIAAIMATTSWS
jgi:hypothetical protein